MNSRELLDIIAKRNTADTTGMTKQAVHKSRTRADIDADAQDRLTDPEAPDARGCPLTTDTVSVVLWSLPARVGLPPAHRCGACATLVPPRAGGAALSGMWDKPLSAEVEGVANRPYLDTAALIRRHALDNFNPNGGNHGRRT